MKKGLKTMHHRLKSDMGLDTKGGFKLAMGLGDGNMPAISLFAMPTLDFTMTKVGKGAFLGFRGLYWGGLGLAACGLVVFWGEGECVMLNALPPCLPKFHC